MLFSFSFVVMSLDHISPEGGQELFESLLNNSYHGIVAFETVRDDSGKIEDFRYIYINRKAESLLHKTAVEVLGKTLLTLFPGTKDEGLFDNFVGVVESGQPFNMDHDYYRDGLAASFQISASKFGDGMAISFVETTKQILMAKYLAKLTERHELATRVAKVGIWDWDVKSDELIWDDMMHEIYGIRPEAFEGATESWEKRVHPEDLSAAQATLQKAIDAKVDLYMKFRIVHPNGEIRWIDARGRTEYDSEGEPVRITGTNWDITELTRAYDDLAEAKEQAEKANAAKSEFLSVMSHELRTPLNPILGFTEILKDQLTDPDNLEIVDVIDQSSRDLLALITDILDFCTIEEGNLALNVVATDVAACTRSVCEEFRTEANHKGLELFVSKSADHPVDTKLDPQRYQQIIRNLVSNAIKFTDSGKIELRIRSGETFRGRRSLVVDVCDTGAGIPEDQIEFIFEHFTQLDASHARSTGGTGLGLALSRQLSRLMGGDITARNRPEGGSVFTLVLPPADSH